MRARSNLRGMTMVEVVVSLALFTTFASSAYFAIHSAASSYRTETVAAHLEFLARKALDDVAERLRGGDYDTITPAPALQPNSFSSLDYQCSRGFVNGAVDWGPVERLTFESDALDPADGADNDSDGLVDEGRLVWLENPAGPGGRRAVLCSQVAATLEGEIAGNGADDNGNFLVDERGFCVEFAGERAIVRITLEQRDPTGRVLRQTSTRTVTPRNTPEE